MHRSGFDADFADLRIGQRAPVPPVELVGHLIDQIERQAQRFADVADGAAAAIGDHRRGHAGAIAAVFFVDVLDHFLAALVLEIDVDVRRLAASGGEETLEQHVDFIGIDAGDSQAIADGRVGRRAATLAENSASRANFTTSYTVRKYASNFIIWMNSSSLPISLRTFSGTPSG